MFSSQEVFDHYFKQVFSNLQKDLNTSGCCKEQCPKESDDSSYQIDVYGEDVTISGELHYKKLNSLLDEYSKYNVTLDELEVKGLNEE